MTAFSISECVFLGLFQSPNSLIEADPEQGFITVERGLFSKTVEYIKFLDIQDVRLHQTWFQSVCDLGDIEIATTEDQTLIFRNVESAREIADKLRSFSVLEIRRYGQRFRQTGLRRGGFYV